MSEEKPLSPPPGGEEGKSTPAFQLNDQEGEFEELEVDPGVPLYSQRVSVDHFPNNQNSSET